VSDRSRGAAAALQGVSWNSEVKADEDGEKSSVSYAVKIRGNDAVAETEAPPRQKGEVALFNDRTLWFYKPGLRKPVSISPRQKLMGQAANGDIASTQYARDYDPASIKDDQVGTEAAWLLDLKAKAKNVTYDRIHYWVSKKTKLAVKAEFLTLSGEVFKVAEFKYGNQIKLKGTNFPFVSEMRIQDAHNPKNVTTIIYRNPREEAHPPSLFNVNNLVK
jgi:outer membrane lipoprotein-sorting protein